MRRLVVLVCLLASACSGDPSGVVSMTPERAFEPASLRVRSGDTVVWSNESRDAHTVTAIEDSLPAGADYFATGGFDSEATATDADNLAAALMIEGDEFSVTFVEPGTYRYYCIPHRAEGMVGTVIVEE
ncbi:MAG: plastocyanin/azurin family copper-binding protein [Actinomycetota bacterium]|nr:plastocyanin/azurin family copper-binding protein [Actinomycetota bacterium]